MRCAPTSSEEDVARCRVPGHDAHTLGVALQNHNGLRYWAGRSVIRDLPNLYKYKEQKNTSKIKTNENTLPTDLAYVQTQLSNGTIDSNVLY